MSQQSITNKIVANIKRTIPSTANFINTQNVVVIDSSNVRIGVNTLKPQYGIDVSGSNAQSWINTKNLKVTNLAQIKEINCDNIVSQTITLKDVSTNSVHTISGNIHYLDSSYINTTTIACQNLASTDRINFNELSGNLVKSQNIYTTDITVLGEIILRQDLDTVNFTAKKITISGNQINTLPTITGNLLNYNYITAIEASLNRLYVKDNAYFSTEASFNNIIVGGAAKFNTMNVLGEASFNTIKVKGEASFNTITVSGSITANTIQGMSLIINNTSFATNNSIGKPSIDGCFNNVIINNNLTFKDPIGSYPTAGGDYSNAYLILPSKTLNSTDPLRTAQYRQSVYFDGNFLHIGDNKIFIEVNYANIKLNTNISGNQDIFNSATQTYHINNSDHLLYSANSNYKYIPLAIDSSINQGIDICNNNYVYFTTPNYTSNTYDIHATVAVKYLNKIPGDVEPNVYTFGLYPHYINPLIIGPGNRADYVDISNSFTDIKNTVLVFDNSYNYSQSTINYLVKINTRPIQFIDDISYNCNGFVLMINSDKDINYIVIDKFNCTIKQIA